MYSRAAVIGLSNYMKHIVPYSYHKSNESNSRRILDRTHSQNIKAHPFGIRHHFSEVSIQNKEELNRRDASEEWIKRDACSNIVCMVLPPSLNVSLRETSLSGLRLETRRHE